MVLLLFGVILWVNCSLFWGVMMCIGIECSCMLVLVWIMKCRCGVVL